jgi:hypothetical protein
MDMHMQIDIDAPASEAWRVLGDDFGALGEWSTNIDSSSLDGELGVGATRTCAFGRSQVTEQLTEFNPDAMVFRYVGTSGMPPGMREPTNRWSIEALGRARCRVHSHATFELAWWLRPFGPLMRLAWGRVGKRFCEELKYRIEQGHPHPWKVEVVAKKAAAQQSRSAGAQAKGSPP